MRTRRVPPPGELIDAGGHRLHVCSRGEGAPPVLLEAGVAASSLSWARVQPALAAFTRVCAYDRAGLAWSDAASSPRTFARILDDLAAVVATLGTGSWVSVGAGQRVILVGHSFGSLIVRGYAARHPEQVAGLVLVDPPMEWLDRAPTQAGLLRRARQASAIGGFLARIGVVRAALALLTGGHPGAPRAFVKLLGPRAAATLERLVGEVRKLPRELHPAVQAHWSEPKCFHAMSEYLGVLQSEAATIAAAVPPSHIPVVVISGAHQPASELAAHERLAAASPHGRHVVAVRSGHWILLDEPDLIVDAVRSLTNEESEVAHASLS
ncbi:MAG: alpha/beta hydrolase [Vicinamibacteraceae bacterium]